MLQLICWWVVNKGRFITDVINSRQKSGGNEKWWKRMVGKRAIGMKEEKSNSWVSEVH